MGQQDIDKSSNLHKIGYSGIQSFELLSPDIIKRKGRFDAANSGMVGELYRYLL
jgi:hypothetical protein